VIRDALFWLIVGACFVGMCVWDFVYAHSWRWHKRQEKRRQRQLIKANIEKVIARSRRRSVYWESQFLDPRNERNDLDRTRGWQDVPAFLRAPEPRQGRGW
jgi:hypothetical protein